MLQIKIPDDLKKAIKLKAKERGLSLASLVIIIFEDYLKKSRWKYEGESIKVYRDFGYITTFEAFTELGCTRLSEYIRQLRLEYNITDEWISTKNRYGEDVKYKKYKLEEKWKKN